MAVDCFNAWDADEIVLLNVERDDSQMNAFVEAVRDVSSCCFLPLAAGGWVTNIERVAMLVENGADKVIINTEGIRRPHFITEVARRFGSQCVVASIDVRVILQGGYEVYVARGSEPTGMALEEVVCRVTEAGAGEILITSIDRDGSLLGYDETLVRKVVEISKVPVICFGGVGCWQDLEAGLEAGADAVAAGNIFHFTEQSTRQAKRVLRNSRFPIR